MVRTPSGDPWEVAAVVAGVLEDVGVRYAIGGSLASGVVGEPRSTLDVDIVVELESDHWHTGAERNGNERHRRRQPSIVAMHWMCPLVAFEPPLRNRVHGRRSRAGVCTGMDRPTHTSAQPAQLRPGP